VGGMGCFFFFELFRCCGYAWVCLFRGLGVFGLSSCTLLFEDLEGFFANEVFMCTQRDRRQCFIPRSFAE